MVVDRSSSQETQVTKICRRLFNHAGVFHFQNSRIIYTSRTPTFIKSVGQSMVMLTIPYLIRNFCFYINLYRIVQLVFQVVLPLLLVLGHRMRWHRTVAIGQGLSLVAAIMLRKH